MILSVFGDTNRPSNTITVSCDSRILCKVNSIEFNLAMLYSNINQNFMVLELSLSSWLRFLKLNVVFFLQCEDMLNAFILSALSCVYLCFNVWVHQVQRCSYFLQLISLFTPSKPWKRIGEKINYPAGDGPGNLTPRTLEYTLFDKFLRSRFTTQ